MKPSILLAAAAFLAVSTDYAIAATLPKPTGDPSARYLQKRSESSSPPSNSIQDNLKRTPSKPVSRVLTDNSVHPGKQSLTKYQDGALENADKHLKELQSYVDELKARYSFDRQPSMFRSISLTSVEALKSLSESLKRNAWPGDVVRKMEILLEFQWEITMAADSHTRPYLSGKGKKRQAQVDLRKEKDVGIELNRLETERKLLSSIAFLKNVPKDLKPYQALFYQWKSAQVLRDLELLYKAIHGPESHTRLLRLNEVAIGTIADIKGSGLLEQKPLKDDPSLSKAIRFPIKLHSNDLSSGQKVQHDMAELYQSINLSLTQINGFLDKHGTLDIIRSMIKKHVKEGPHKLPFFDLRLQLHSYAASFLYRFLDTLDERRPEDISKVYDQFVKLMWTASALASQSDNRLFFPSQLNGPPTDADLQSLEGWCAEVSRINWNEFDTDFTSSADEDKLGQRLFNLFRLEQFKKDIARVKRYQSQVFQEERKVEAIKRMRDHLLTGGNRVPHPGDQQIPQQLELSEEEQAQVVSKDFKGEVAEEFLKNLVEKVEDQDLVGDQNLALVTGRGGEVIGRHFTKVEQYSMAHEILSNFKGTNSDTKDASIKRRVIDHLLPIRSLHAKIAEEVTANMSFFVGKGRRYLESFKGLEVVLANGIYHSLLMAGLQNTHTTQLSMMLAESKDLQGRIAGKIIQGLEAKESLKGPASDQMSKKQIAEKKLQGLVAEKVLEQITRNVQFFDGIFDETFRDLLNYGRFLDLVNDKTSLDGLLKNLDLSVLESKVQQISLKSRQELKFQELEAQLRKLLGGI